MSDFHLPPEINREIFLRVPAESLLHSRFLCEECQCDIDDPDFVKAHTKNQPVFPNTLLICGGAGDADYSISLDSLNFFINGPQIIQATRLKEPIPRDLWSLPLAVASCNGLILITRDYTFQNNWAIWNPLIGQCRVLPNPPNDRLELLSCGFGYDSSADDYKFVRIHRASGLQESYTRVYSLKTNSWRLVEDRPNLYCLSRPGVFLNGALHWLSLSKVKEQNAIIAFDLSNENYRQLPLPPSGLPFTRPFKLGLGLGTCEVYLDASGGCIMLSYFKDKSFVGWVMKDYGVPDSWMQLFSFEEPYILDVAKTLRPLAYLKDKNQVFMQYSGGFLWFDVESNSVKRVSIDGLANIFPSQICPGSLFWLHDGGSAAAKTTEAKTRLTFHVRDISSSTSSDSSGSSES